MAAAGLAGVFLAIFAALSWGGGDFSGGLASRRLNQYQVLALSALTGTLGLGVAAWFTREPIPAFSSIVLAAAAGAFGALGIAALYKVLGMGNMAVVAPIAAVVGAASPVLFSLFVEGRPDLNQGIGLVIALTGLWVVSSTGRHTSLVTQESLFLALIAGFGFGGFFILIDQVAPGSNFLTLLSARLASFLIALIGLSVLRLPLPDPRSHPAAMLAGLLDTGGNIFFLLASQFTRLDIAVVIASLYPAVTVFLARALLREEVARRQWVGVGLCLLAIAVILV